MQQEEAATRPLPPKRFAKNTTSPRMEKVLATIQADGSRTSLSSVFQFSLSPPGGPSLRPGEDPSSQSVSTQKSTEEAPHDTPPFTNSNAPTPHRRMHEQRKVITSSKAIRRLFTSRETPPPPPTGEQQKFEVFKTFEDLRPPALVNLKRKPKLLLPPRRTLSPEAQPPAHYFSLESDHPKRHFEMRSMSEKIDSKGAFLAKKARRPMTSQKFMTRGLQSEESEDFDDLKTFRKLIDRQQRLEPAPFSAPRLAMEQPDEFMQQTYIPGFVLQPNQQLYVVQKQQPPPRTRGVSCPSSQSHRRPAVVKTNKIPEVFTHPVPASPPAANLIGGFTFQPQCLQIYNMQSNVITASPVVDHHHQHPHPHPHHHPFVIPPQVHITTASPVPPSEYGNFITSPGIRMSHSENTLEQYRPYSNRQTRKPVTSLKRSSHPDAAEEEARKTHQIKKKNDRFMGAILMNQNKAHLIKNGHYFSKKKKSLAGTEQSTARKSKKIIDLSVENSEKGRLAAAAHFTPPPPPMKSYLQNSKRLTPRSGVFGLSKDLTSSMASKTPSTKSLRVSEVEAGGGGGSSDHYFKERRVSEPVDPRRMDLICEEKEGEDQ